MQRPCHIRLAPTTSWHENDEEPEISDDGSWDGDRVTQDSRAGLSIDEHLNTGIQVHVPSAFACILLMRILTRKVRIQKRHGCLFAFHAALPHNHQCQTLEELLADGTCADAPRHTAVLATTRRGRATSRVIFQTQIRANRGSGVLGSQKEPGSRRSDASRRHRDTCGQLWVVVKPAFPA